MCGIIGWLGHGEELRGAGDRALAALATRGPDGHGLWIDDIARVALGNARLAILDPRPRASQPMTRGDRRISHNGEIYNFIELRAELEARGERFTTSSDTEVLLAACQVWGDDALARLNGMWAFAVWDRGSGRMLLSRDRLGVKPLFLARGTSCLHFASEIKALLGHACINWSPNAELLHTFVTTGATADGSRATFMRGIERVAPATATWIDAASLRATERRFWSLPAASGRSALSLADAASHLDDLLEDAVRLRLRSDVAVGLTLSGGVDSSSIAAAVSRLGAAPAVRAFSVRWPSVAADEGPLIASARSAAHLEGEAVTAHPLDLPAAIEQLIWHQDEPFAHTAAFGQWMVYRLAAANGVHVLLEGQGADEVFGGYQAFSFGGRFAALAGRGDLLTLIDEVWTYRRVQQQSLRRAASYAVLAAAPPRARSALRALRWRSSGLGGPNAAPAPFDSPSGRDGALRRGLRDATLSSSLPALLRYADRSSMAHSVEVRLPFLDHRIVSFASELDESFLVSAGWTKRVVREALRRHMPALADQRGKFGFTAPEDLWIRGPLSPWIAGLVQRADQRGLFPQGAAAKVWTDTQAGRVPAQVVWRIVVAELWLQRYADAGGRAP